MGLLHAPAALPSGEELTFYPLDINLVGSQSWYGHFWSKKYLLPPFENGTPCHWSPSPPPLSVSLSPSRLFVIALLDIVIEVTLSCTGDIHKTGNLEFDNLKARCVDMTVNQFWESGTHFLCMLVFPETELTLQKFIQVLINLIQAPRFKRKKSFELAMKRWHEAVTDLVTHSTWQFGDEFIHFKFSHWQNFLFQKVWVPFSPV